MMFIAHNAILYSQKLEGRHLGNKLFGAVGLAKSVERRWINGESGLGRRVERPVRTLPLGLK